MKNSNENGITLMALIVTVVLLAMVASIGVGSGTKTIKVAKYNQFKNELQILQSKINELNQTNTENVGTDLTDEQEKILDIAVISNIIYKDKTDDEKSDIKNNFKFIAKNNMKQELGLDGIKRDYLINIKYRYVVCYKGFEYNGTVYYMSEQFNNGLYNVEYRNKNSNGVADSSSTALFETKKTSGEGRCKITITNINYDGYINDWQVKYKMQGDEFWQTSYTKDFYVTEPGYYIINVVHGNEVDLGTITVEVVKGQDIIIDEEKTNEMENTENTEKTISNNTKILEKV